MSFNGRATAVEGGVWSCFNVGSCTLPREPVWEPKPWQRGWTHVSPAHGGDWYDVPPIVAHRLVRTHRTEFPSWIVATVDVAHLSYLTLHMQHCCPVPAGPCLHGHMCLWTLVDRGRATVKPREKGIKNRDDLVAWVYTRLPVELALKVFLYVVK